MKMESRSAYARASTNAPVNEHEGMLAQASHRQKSCPVCWRKIANAKTHWTVWRRLIWLANSWPLGNPDWINQGMYVQRSAISLEPFTKLIPGTCNQQTEERWHLVVEPRAQKRRIFQEWPTAPICDKSTHERTKESQSWWPCGETDWPVRERGLWEMDMGSMEQNQCCLPALTTPWTGPFGVV